MSNVLLLAPTAEQVDEAIRKMEYAFDRYSRETEILTDDIYSAKMRGFGYQNTYMNHLAAKAAFLVFCVDDVVSSRQMTVMRQRELKEREARYIQVVDKLMKSERYDGDCPESPMRYGNTFDGDWQNELVILSSLWPLHNFLIYS